MLFTSGPAAGDYTINSIRTIHTHIYSINTSYTIGTGNIYSIDYGSCSIRIYAYSIDSVVNSNAIKSGKNCMLSVGKCTKV